MQSMVEKLSADIALMEDQLATLTLLRQCTKVAKGGDKKHRNRLCAKKSRLQRKLLMKQMQLTMVRQGMELEKLGRPSLLTPRVLGKHSSERETQDSTNRMKKPRLGDHLDDLSDMWVDPSMVVETVFQQDEVVCSLPGENLLM